MLVFMYLGFHHLAASHPLAGGFNQVAAAKFRSIPATPATPRRHRRFLRGFPLALETPLESKGRGLER
jgi:hypothetical protein